MKNKRSKASRRLMKLYTATFGFREPWQLVVDSDFLLSCVTQKMEFSQRLQDVLHGTVKPMITQCSMEKLYRLKTESAKEAIELAKSFERRFCGHVPLSKQKEAVPIEVDGEMTEKKGTLSEDECLTSIVGPSNSHRYIIATQSIDLRTALRKIPGTPLVYINRSVILLEDISNSSSKAKLQKETAKLHISTSEKKALAKAPQVDLSASTLIGQISEPTVSSRPDHSGAQEETEGQQGGATAGLVLKKKKRKGPKGPNPLSVKKRKPVPNLAKKREGTEVKPDVIPDVKLDGRPPNPESKKRSREANEEKAEPAASNKRRRKRKAKTITGAVKKEES